MCTQALSAACPYGRVCLLLQAMEELRRFKPDVIIALGGGSPMDAAKLMWLMYEHPETKFEEVAARFMVIRPPQACGAC